MSEKPKSTTTDEEEMDRLARQMLLDEAKRNEIRAQTQGALGWKKPTVGLNRKFLHNTLISNAVHNIHRNEQEKQRRTQYKDNRKKRRSPSPSADDHSTSKRSKKDR